MAGGNSEYVLASTALLLFTSLSWNSRRVVILLFFFLSLLQYVLNPTFTVEQIKAQDMSAKLSRAYDGTTYLPGISLCISNLLNHYINTDLNLLIFLYDEIN